MTFGNPIVGSAGVLIREQIQSPDFVSGVSGWIVRRDGSAEFNDVTVRGEFIVGTYPGGPYARLTAAPADGPGLYLGTGSANEALPGLVSSSDLVAGLATLLQSPDDDPAHTDYASLDLIQWSAIVGGPPDVYAMGSALARPFGGAWNAPAQSIPNNTITTLTGFSGNAIQVNNGGLGGTYPAITVASGVFTPQEPGIWMFLLAGRWTANATGLRMLYARDKAGNDFENDHEFAPAVTRRTSIKGFWMDSYNGSSDTFRWRAEQNSGAGLTLNVRTIALRWSL